MIRELDSVDDPAYVEFLELFIESFHAWGREPVPTVTAQVRAGKCAALGERYRIWVAEVDGRVAGLIRGAYLPRAESGFVVHIAVHPDHRRQGIASRLIEAAEAGFRADAGTLPFRGTTFEIERIEDAESDEHRDECDRRIRFFWSQGCVLVTPAYTQPPMDRWLPAMPLNLMMKPASGEFDAESLIRGLYADAYRLESGDPLVERAIAGIASPVPRKALT
jgi:GNAT superfamily N-acetyltransferase